MMPRRRQLLIALVVLAVLAGFVWALQPQPVPADLAMIERGMLRVTVDEEGETRVRDVYVVSAPVDGRLLRIDVEVGDRVRAERTVLASMQPRAPTFLDRRAREVAEAELRAADAAVILGEAQVRRAEAEVDFAERDVDRAERLSRSEAISAEAIDRARLDLAVAEATLAEAKAHLAVQREELARARAALIEPTGASAPGFDPVACCVAITAPVDGTILAVHHESEQVVAAGTPLLEIGNPRQLELVVDLLSTDAVKVEPGAEATIEAWGEDEILRARVRRVEPAGFTEVSALGIEEQRVRVVLDFTDPPERWRRLGHGYRIEARITIWRDDDVLLVPLSALFREGDAWAAFVLEDQVAKLHEIDIGHRDDRQAEVLSGLEAGQRVVVHPSDRVTDGVSVAPRVGDR